MGTQREGPGRLAPGMRSPCLKCFRGTQRKHGLKLRGWLHSLLYEGLQYFYSIDHRIKSLWCNLCVQDPKNAKHWKG